MDFSHRQSVERIVIKNSTFYLKCSLTKFISMKKFFVALLILSIKVLYVFPQNSISKPAIDTIAYKTWSSVGKVKISNDGKYVLYSITNEPLGSQTLVIKSIEGKWEKKYIGSKFADFSSNSTIVILDKPDGNGLYMINLKDKKQVEISKYVRFIKELNLLTYLKEDRLIIEDPLAFKKDTVDNVKEYRFLDGTNGLLITQKNKEQTESLDFSWYDLSSKKKISIWQGNSIENIISSTDGKAIAFIAENKALKDSRNVCVYQYPNNKSEVVFEENRLIGQRIENLRMFCANNNNLIVTIREKDDTPLKAPNSVDVNIWSYKDNQLQPKQLLSPFPIYTALINNSEKSLTPLTEADEYLRISNQSKSAKWGLIEIYSAPKGLNDDVKKEVVAVSLVTGKRVKMNQKLVTFAMISPNEKFLIYFDGIEKNFFSYEISTGITRNITNGIKTEWGIYSRTSRGIPGWTEEDKDVLIYDKYDIWQIDPLAKRPAINITHQFGIKNNIRFNFILDKNEDNTLPQYSTQLLTAFNLTTYENGFYKIQLEKSAVPKKLFMGKYLFNAPDNNATGFMPLKAKKADVYIVKRMNASQSPNFFVTNDFIHYKELSSVYPEKEWTWLSSELHVYDTINNYKGALYKPDNFDSSKRYPVILYYYEQLSDRLNFYFEPNYSIGLIDIPTFVSNGYIVFCLDIDYKIGFPGESALKCVTAAAEYLKNLPYVDSKNMGINGHSFGGYATNYIVTHTSLFKAACAGAGPSDLISFYGSIWNGESRQGMVENGQVRMGKTLWTGKDLYIKNSPIFDADKVTTPLLLFHGNEDEGVPIAQSIEFFAALHRMKKRVWLLQYMNAGHTISKRKDQVDFTIRIQQFFDHYLKGAPSPQWMTLGRPAKLKGIDNRLEIDSLNSTP